MSRTDGRGADHVRPLHIATSVVANCAGSAAVEVGGTRVVACALGPLQLTAEYRGDLGRIICSLDRCGFASAADPTSGEQQLATAPTRRGKAPSAEELEFGGAIAQALEQAVLLDRIPQILYDVRVEVLSSEGPQLDFAPAVMAAAAALAMADVEMQDLVLACDACLMEDGSIVADPTASELEAARGRACVAVLASADVLVHSVVEGAQLDAEQVAALLQAATAGSRLHSAQIRKALLPSHS